MRRPDVVECMPDEGNEIFGFHVVAAEKFAEALVLGFARGLAQESAEESGGDLGSKLESGIFSQIFDRLRSWAATLVRAISGHRVERVGEVYDLCDIRYLAVEQAVRISAAVEPFVMVAHRIRGFAVAEEVDLVDHLERLTAGLDVPALELWPLQCHARLAEAVGDTTAYRRVVTRYRDLAEALDARGHIAIAKQLTADPSFAAATS